MPEGRLCGQLLLLLTAGSLALADTDWNTPIEGECTASNGDDDCEYEVRNCSLTHTWCNSSCSSPTCYSTFGRFARWYALVCYAERDGRCYELIIRTRTPPAARGTPDMRCDVSDGDSCVVSSVERCDTDYDDATGAYQCSCTSTCSDFTSGASAGSTCVCYNWAYWPAHGSEEMCVWLCIEVTKSSQTEMTPSSSTSPKPVASSMSSSSKVPETEMTPSSSTSPKPVAASMSSSTNIPGTVSESSMHTVWILVGVCATLGFLLLVAILAVVLLILRMRHLAPFKRHNDESTDSPYQLADASQVDIHPYSTVQTATKPGETANTSPSTSRAAAGYKQDETARAAAPAHPAVAPVYAMPSGTSRPGTLHPTDEDYGTTLVDNTFYGSRSSGPSVSNESQNNADYDLTVIDNALYDGR